MDFENIKQKINDFLTEIKARFSKSKDKEEDEFEDEYDEELGEKTEDINVETAMVKLKNITPNEEDEEEFEEEDEETENLDLKSNIKNLFNKFNKKKNAAVDENNNDDSEEDDDNEDDEDDEDEEEYDNKIDELKYKLNDFLASLKSDKAKLRKTLIYIVVLGGGGYVTLDDLLNPAIEEKPQVKKIKKNHPQKIKRIKLKEPEIKEPEIKEPEIKEPVIKEPETDLLNLGEGGANNSSTGNSLEDLSKKIIKNIPAKEKEYVPAPSYNKEGRGLVYNCEKGHWACVDKFSYYKCFSNQKWNKLKYNKPECIVKDVYKNISDCRKIQKFYINRNAKTYFCKSPEKPKVEENFN